jgi:hypothetical protein
VAGAALTLPNYAAALAPSKGLVRDLGCILTIFVTVFQRFVGYLSTSSVETRKGRAMKMLFARFMQDETGATAIECGLIATGILVAFITIMTK